jgi:hypothetical protein
MLNEARPKATTEYDRRAIDESLKLFAGAPAGPIKRGSGPPRK